MTLLDWKESTASQMIPASEIASTIWDFIYIGGFVSMHLQQWNAIKKSYGKYAQIPDHSNQPPPTNLKMILMYNSMIVVMSQAQNIGYESAFDV